MKQNLEIEYKTILNESSYEKIQQAWNFSDGQKQVNVYLDTLNDDLFKQKKMCRLRLTDIIEFTLKTPQRDGVMEHELILDSFDITQNSIINDLLSDNNINVNDLVEVARSYTLRKTFDDQYGTWCLDFTEFDHGSDYEIEYELFEYNENAFDHYLKTLENFGIEYKKSRPKYIRARFPDETEDYSS